MPKSLEQKLKEEIGKTGFPLEIFVASVFKKSGWSVIHNPNYFDREENKTRPLDLKTTKRYSKTSGEAIDLMILAECKKSENKPWIFFQTEFQPDTDFDEGLIKCNEDTRKLFEVMEADKLSNLNVFKHKNKARTYFEAFKKESKKKTSYLFDIEEGITIFSSAIKLAKGTIHFMQKFSQYKKLFFYPAIIFDGKMFSFSILPNGEHNLTEVDYLQLDFFFSPIVQEQVWLTPPSKPTWEWPSAALGESLRRTESQPTLFTYQDIKDERFSIDVVKKEFLETYLDDFINNDTKILLEILEGKKPKDIQRGILN